VTARIKEVASLIKKVESKQIKDPFVEVPDIVGARIVALFLSDIQKVIDVLVSAFDITFIDNKIDDTDPRLFGYFSVHLHGRIKESYVGTRYDRIKTIPFEVQIRTIAMDAWASASHYLDYKSVADVPADLRRDFNALSGLFYVADKHFEMFFRSRAAAIRKIDQSFKDQKPPLDRPINFDTLMAFLNDRYPDRESPDSGDVSELLAELRKAKINDLGTLAERLNEVEKWFLHDEQNNPPVGLDDFDEDGEFVEGAPSGRYTATGAVRVSIGHKPTAQKRARQKRAE
jgi:putative GTP pyrophosphokinase